MKLKESINAREQSVQTKKEHTTKKRQLLASNKLSTTETMHDAARPCIVHAQPARLRRANTNEPIADRMRTWQGMMRRQWLVNAFTLTTLNLTKLITPHSKAININSHNPTTLTTT